MVLSVYKSIILLHVYFFFYFQRSAAPNRKLDSSFGEPAFASPSKDEQQLLVLNRLPVEAKNNQFVVNP